MLYHMVVAVQITSDQLDHFFSALFKRVMCEMIVFYPNQIYPVAAKPHASRSEQAALNGFVLAIVSILVSFGHGIYSLIVLSMLYSGMMGMIGLGFTFTVIPFLPLLLNSMGLILSSKGLYSTKRKLALIGFVITLMGLLWNFFFGLYAFVWLTNG